MRRKTRKAIHDTKRYKKPVITAIDLDPKAAILTSCVVGGAYFDRISLSFCLPRGYGTHQCRIANRSGVRGYWQGAVPTVTPRS